MLTIEEQITETVYCGERDEGATWGVRVWSIQPGTVRECRRLDLVAKQPLDWGDTGDGCTRLALVILQDYLANKDAAKKYAPAFAASVVRHLPKNQWQLGVSQIKAVLEQIEESNGRARRRNPLGIGTRTDWPEPWHACSGNLATIILARDQTKPTGFRPVGLSFTATDAGTQKAAPLALAVCRAIANGRAPELVLEAARRAVRVANGE